MYWNEINQAAGILVTQFFLIACDFMLLEFRYDLKKTLKITIPVAMAITLSCIMILLTQGSDYYNSHIPYIATLPYFLLHLYVSKLRFTINVFMYSNICSMGAVTLVNGYIIQKFIGNPWGNTVARMMTLGLIFLFYYSIRTFWQQAVQFLKNGWLLLCAVPLYTNMMFLFWLNSAEREELLVTLWSPYLLFLLGFIVYGIIYYLFKTLLEKHELSFDAATLNLQVTAMKQQIYSQQKSNEKMDILRHDMRHEMRMMAELFRTGKTQEAEVVFEEWLTDISSAAMEVFCAEPVLNAVLTMYSHRAAEQNIALQVYSTLPASLPIDSIKLSVILSNALENAVSVTAKAGLEHPAVRVKLITTAGQIGIEVKNPCTQPVEFDLKGLPVAEEAGHGLGTRSIAAYAKEYGAALDFHCKNDLFTMRLLVRIPETT